MGPRSISNKYSPSSSQWPSTLMYSHIPPSAFSIYKKFWLLSLPTPRCPIRNITTRTICRYYPYHRIVALNFPHKRFLWGWWHRGQVHLPWMPVFLPHARHFQCVYQKPRLFRSSLSFKCFCRSLIFLFMTSNSSRCRRRRSSSLAVISLSRRLYCF